MFKKLAAFAAASALMAAPAVAQPMLASASLERAGANLTEENELGGGILVAVLGVAIVAGAVLAITDDSDEDLPDSP